MIIFLNGTLNAGKSTVAKLLEKRLPRTAVVEVDSLRNFIAWLDIDEAIPLNLKNAASVVRNFAEAGFNVIVPYPMSEADHSYLLSQLNGMDTTIHVITLRPTIEKASASTYQRTLSEWERQRIKHHHVIGLTDPGFGIIIDNTSQTPEQTVAAVLKSLGLPSE